MNITVIGSGYVGTTTAAILANCGHQVVAIDIDEAKVKTINSGNAPFFEVGITELIKAALDKKTLRATSSYENGIKNADIIFSCVGTPDNPDGSSNLSYVFSAAKEAAKFMKGSAIFVQKSTVPVGTGQQVKELIDSGHEKHSYVSNPEFLREGSAVIDTLLFDRVVVGGPKKATKLITEIYKDIEKRNKMIADAAGLDMDENIITSHSGSYVHTSLQSAELIKVTANAFLALKISFANSIAKLADSADADITEVMDAVGSDKRIGRDFLNAGRGYGGGCFPKDVSALINSAHAHGVDMSIMDSATAVNSSMPGYVINKLQNKLTDKNLVDKKIAVLGLAFKANTSDARKSPAVALANLLSKKGAVVRVYDPQANDEAKEDLLKNVNICNSAEEAVDKCTAVVIATDWNEFTSMSLDKLALMTKGNIFIDAMNAFDSSAVEEAGFAYVGIGR